MENSVEVSQKIKSRITIKVVPLLGIYPKEMNQYIKYIYLQFHVNCNIFPIPKIWSQPKCPSMDEWRKEPPTQRGGGGKWNTTLGREEIPSFATIWIYIQDIMSGEISQAQEEKCYRISLTCGI